MGERFVTNTIDNAGMQDLLRLGGLALKRHPPRTRPSYPPPPPPRKSGRGAEPVGALGRTARRLKAGLAALFLITLAAALAPQDAQAQAPDKPSGLAATPGAGNVVLTWNAQPGQQITQWLYQVKLSTDNWPAASSTINGTGATTSLTITRTTISSAGLTNGSSYDFRIRARSGSSINTSPWSDVVTATPTATPPVTINLTATPGNARIDLSWTYSGSTASASKWQVEYFSGSTGDQWRDIPGGVAARSVALPLAGRPALVNDDTYNIRVRLVTSRGDTLAQTVIGNTGWVTATPTAATTTAVPAAPTGLTATPGGPAQVLLTWTKPTGTITGYKLRYAKTPSKASATWNTMTGSGANTVRHMVTGLDNDAEYSFMIRAVNTAGDGADTGWVTATPADSCPGVGAPTNLSLAARSDGFAVTWTAPTDVLRNGWELSYKKTGGTSTSVTISNAAATSHTLTGLDAGTEYEIALQAMHPVNPDPTASCPPGSRVKATGTTLAAASTKTITLSATSTSITEGDSGSTDVTVTVTLGEAAPAGFSITVTSDSPSGTAKGSNKGRDPCTAPLIPADTDWCYPASVTVSIAEGETMGTMKVRILGDTRDEPNETIRLLGYETGWTSGRLTLTITDDDDPPTAGVTISTAALTVAEGGSGTYTVKLNTKPGGSVTVTPTSSAGTVATVSGALTFTTGTWGTEQTVTVSGVNNAVAGGAGSATVSHAVTGYGAVSTAASVTVTVTDDDTAGVTVSKAELTVAEGSTGTYTVKLNTKPAGSVTVTPTSSAGAVATVSGALTFTTGTWGTEQTVTVSGVNNAVAGGAGSATVSHAVTGYGAVSTAASVTVTVTDDDTAGVTVSKAELTVAEGSTGTYTVKLNTKPAGSVTVTPTSSAGAVATVSGALTFTTGTWGTEQTVTVSGVNNAVAGGAGSATVSHAVTGYGSVSMAASVTVTVTDDDTAGVTVSKAELTVAEGATGTYTMKLNTKPGGSVTVTPTSSAGTVATVSGALTFTTGTWGTEQTVTVSGVNNAVAGGAGSATVSHAVTGYGSVSMAASVTVTVTDDDAAGVTVSDPTRSTITEAAGPAHTATYTVRLATEPSGAVTVTVTPGAGVTVNPTALTFTTGTWGTAQTVTVTAVDDRVDDGASKEATVAHRAAGGGAGYAGGSVRTLTFTVTDDDAPVPAKPAQLTATPGDGQVALAWADAGDASITGWQVRQQVGAGSYGAWSAIPGAGASTTSHLVTGLTNDTAYTFQVRAENRTGAGAASDAVTATPRGDDGSANAVHRTVLPQVAAVVVSQSLGVVADRIEAVAGGVAGGSLRLGAQPMAPGPVGGVGRRPVAGAGPSLAEVLDGVAFTLPLGSGEAGGLPPVAVWGRGERVAVAGSEDAVSWDGGLWGAHLGADVRLRPDLLAGVAVSYSLGELDAEHTGQTRTTRSTYETDLTAVQPYVAWLGADGSSLWASAGYGWGEVQLEEMGRAARQTDLTFASTAVGGRGVLGADAEWIAGGMTRLAIKGEGSLAWMETEAGAGLAGLAVDTRRLRLALQGSHERAVAGGATLTPAVEVGLRHDGGDATQGAGMEAGASLRYRDPGLGLTVEVRTRTLLVHERDREEWGVSGLVRLDPAVDGRGLFLTLAPERGGTASGLGQLFARTPGAAQAPGGGGPVASRLAAEVGHGFGVTGWGQRAVVTPYAGVTLVERGERHWRLGTRYLVGGLELSLEAARRASRTTPAADSLMIQAGLQW